MFNTKICLAIGALFLANFTVVSAVECEGCVADSFVDLMEHFDLKRVCWISTKHQFLVKVQMVAVEEINDNLVRLHESINQVVDDKCKTDVVLRSCQMTNMNDLSQCLMDNMRTLSYSYRDQEKCHGKAFDFEVLDFVFGQMSAYFDAQIEIQPEC